MRDVAARGRRKGERNPNAKITADIVREIRRRWVPGKPGYGPQPNSTRTLAKEFGLDPSTVYQVAVGKRWSHID